MGEIKFIVSANWLVERLGNPEIAIVDASWYLPDVKRSAREEYLHAHIPGAVFFDFEEIRDRQSNLPNMLPSPQKFSQHASALGLTRNKTIVVYDGPGYFSAPRAWWMLRVMGAKDVFILDGGFDHWREQGLPVTQDAAPVAASVFVPDFDASRVVSLAEMRQIVQKQETQIVDARNHARFCGTVREPRPGMRSGHMPGAHNVPASQLAANGVFKSLAEIKTIFATANVDITRPIVATCGSGVTAATLIFALEALGHHHARLYDGSWSEWGRQKDTQIIEGDE